MSWALLFFLWCACVCFFPVPFTCLGAFFLSAPFLLIRSLGVVTQIRSHIAHALPPRSPERLVHCTFCRARRLESFLPRGTLLWSVVQSPFGTPIYSASPNAQKMVYNTWYTANTFREYTVQLQQYVMYDTEKNNKRSQPPTK